ncbi:MULTISPECIES: class I SAM-dependent DNA methyltransferase [Thiorhodovibrio]|uniref:class I SAM-dependent DNA methyltransferase n=1 Tax=Thiorhodovibrio TaxID=61593 RepID=UPI001912BC93|nr:MULTISPECIES: N-6 DNA methylase [Thiorhodovibrio]MBK5969833.1 restriction endonuclease subunit M [Thiorhodovibrio winogradskyi]WPL12123.1 Type I restriction enzyme EcoKI M protein [Thiorhodovibrio litoralis]
MNLSTTIKSIQDIMRKDDGVDGDAQRIGQLSWMLFLKIFDQCEDGWQDDAETQGRAYRSAIPEDCRWRNWAAYIDDKPQIPAGDLIGYVNNTVFPGLKELPVAGNPAAKVVREVFVDANNYMKSGTLMLGVIEKLEAAIDFHDLKARGQLGDIYEQVLNDLRSAGNAGEFYTPRAITEFMVDRVNPRLGNRETGRETVLDPACGTGGFLTATIAHIEAQLDAHSGPDDRRAIAQCIRGMEKKQLPHLLCTTNLMLHGIEVPSMIEHRNTLAHGWNSWSKRERVDCVITNPPFGGMEDDTVGNDYLLPTRETADMFMTLIVNKLLKEPDQTGGGRAGVVLPDGFLFGEGIKAKIKEELLDKCHLHTVIRLPNGVFNPYTGIKTNLLFFTRGRATDDIWFYEHRYPQGVKSYSKTKPLRIDELQPIKDWWGSEADGFQDRVETEQAWRVDFKTLKAEAIAKAQPHWDQAGQLNNQANDLNEQAKTLRASIRGENDPAKRQPVEDQVTALTERIDTLRQQAKEAQAAGDRHYWPIYNLDLKNPNAPEAESHDPDVLLAKYKQLLAEIEQTQNQLRDELAKALAHRIEAEASGS